MTVARAVYFVLCTSQFVLRQGAVQSFCCPPQPQIQSPPTDDDGMNEPMRTHETAPRKKKKQRWRTTCHDLPTQDPRAGSSVPLLGFSSLGVTCRWSLTREMLCLHYACRTSSPLPCPNRREHQSINRGTCSSHQPHPHNRPPAHSPRAVCNVSCTGPLPLPGPNGSDTDFGTDSSASQPAIPRNARTKASSPPARMVPGSHSSRTIFCRFRLPGLSLRRLLPRLSAIRPCHGAF